MSSTGFDGRRFGPLRRKRWLLLGVIVLIGWWYAAPIILAKRIRHAVEENGATASIVAARVDFAQVNGRLQDDLRLAARGGLNGQSFSRLLLFGWLPEQRQKAKSPTPILDHLPVHARYTRVFRVRYRAPNRVIAIFWDPTQMHQVVLTLQRESVFQRWKVTKVTQFNVCAYDFDCALVP